MTRPARSSSTAGSGMPETTALTAVVSTGLTPRTSAREVATLCNRQGTSAAAAMQMKIATARSRDNSPSATTTESASPAASRMIAECRKRSDHGENEAGEEEGASIAIRPASPFASTSSSTGVAALSHVSSLARRSGIELERRLTQALRSRPEDNLPKRQQDYRYDERGNIIEDAEQQHPGQKVLAVHLPQADQHGGIEHPKASGGVAGKAQQGRRDEDHRDHDKAEIGLVGHQHIHRQRAKAEVHDPDRDLQQGQRTARQHHGPRPTSDRARRRPDPDHIADQRQDDGDRDGAVQPGRKL